MKRQPTGGKRLVAYYRYSGGSHQTEQSIEGQRRDCETYARIHGMVILHEYIDRHISGKTDDRPEFQQMIADAGKGMFDYVICWKTDRIARSRYDSIVYKKKLRDNGVELLYAAEANVEGSGGIIVEGLMEALAEYYSAELAEKVRRGMRESALKGKAIGSSRPLGLTVDKDKKYIIDPAGAAAVRYIFEQYAAGAASSDIVAHLNEQGLCTSRGNPFNKSSVVRIIRNEVYRGVYVSPKFDVRIEGAVGEYDITADELLSGAGGNTATKTEQAERLILDLLADGKELASEDIVKAAAEAGISERTVQNAKRNMGGILGARRVGGQWYNFIKKKQPPEPAS